jgi:dihydroorotase
MLVDKPESLERIFAESPVLIATHCEDEATILKNSQIFRKKYGENVHIRHHPEIRSAEACFISSSLAVNLAQRYGSKLHLLHLSTAREIALLEKGDFRNKQITAEVCIHHLLFSDHDYDSRKTFIKWNPAIKKESDRQALFSALLNDGIDLVATDHAPHLRDEKTRTYFQCPSGGPMVQHSLGVMLEFWKKGFIPIEKVVEKMSHAPSTLFHIKQRGYIREGYYADLVIIDPDAEWQVQPSNILYKCGWSPLEGEILHTRVHSTFVNGEMVYSEGRFDDRICSMPLMFER